MRFYVLFLVALGVVAGGCAGDKAASDAVIGQVNGAEVRRLAFLDALVLDQGEAFLARYAERLLVDQAAREAGVTVTDEAVARAVDLEIQQQITDRFGGQRAQLDQRLARYGQTFERWREGRLRDRRVLMQAHAVLQAKVDPKRVEALFEQRFGKGGVRRQVRQILISTQVPASRFYPQAEFEAEREVVEAEGRERAFTWDGQRFLEGDEPLDERFSDRLASVVEGLRASHVGPYGAAASADGLSPGRLTMTVTRGEGIEPRQLVVRVGAPTGTEATLHARRDDLRVGAAVAETAVAVLFELMAP